MKIALLQLNSGSDMQANIAAVGKMVREAHAQGATLIATPENTFLMQEPGAERSHYTQENHPGVAAACAWAKEFGVWLLIGSVHCHAGNSEHDKHYNRSLLINPQGIISAQYDKIHLFDVDVPGDRHYRESDRFLGGSKVTSYQLPVTSKQNTTLVTRLGLTICYDVRFPHLYRTLAKAGANIIAVPAAFTQVTGEAHWHVLLRARAIENGCFIIAPAQTGTHPGNRKTYGHSLVVDPWGRVIADGGMDVGIVYADIDLDEVQKVRSRLPSLEHDREFV